MQKKFFYFRCKYFGSLEGKKLEKVTWVILLLSLTYLEWVSGFLFIYIFLPEKEQRTNGVYGYIVIDTYTSKVLLIS